MGYRLGIELSQDGLRVAEDDGEAIHDLEVVNSPSGGESIGELLVEITRRWAQRRNTTVDEVVIAHADDEKDAAATLGRRLAVPMRTVSASVARTRTDAPDSVYAIARGALLIDKSTLGAAGAAGAAGVTAAGVAASGAGGNAGGDDGDPAASMEDFGDGRRMGDFAEQRTMDEFGAGREMAGFGAGASMDEFRGATPATDEKPRSARGKVLAAAALVAVLVLLAGAIALAGSGDDDDSDDVAATAPTTTERTTTTLRAAEARLEGGWIVEITTTESEGSASQFHPDSPVGTTVSRRWAIAPSCPTGPCDITVVRESSSGEQTNVFSFADGVYRFRESADGFCFDSSTGETRTDLPTTVSAEWTLRVTEVDDSGAPSRFELEIVTVQEVEIEEDQCTDGRDVQEGVGLPA